MTTAKTSKAAESWLTLPKYCKTFNSQQYEWVDDWFNKNLNILTFLQRRLTQLFQQVFADKVFCPYLFDFPLISRPSGPHPQRHQFCFDFGSGRSAFKTARKQNQYIFFLPSVAVTAITSAQLSFIEICAFLLGSRATELRTVKNLAWKFK